MSNGITIDNSKPKCNDGGVPIKTLITPEIAKRMLSSNGKNRIYSKERENDFATLMKTGQFQCTPHGIIIDSDGILVDGQHRLGGVIKSGCSVYMYVTKGVPPECRLAVDNGRIRNSVAIAHITGRKNDTAKHYTLAKYLKLGPERASHKRIPEVFLQQYVDEFSPSIEFVLSCSKGVPAVIQSVCARAWYTKDHAKIARFLKVYSTGVTNGENESAVVKLKNMVMEKKFVGKVYVSSTERIPSMRAFHQFSENALDNFLNGYPVKTLKRSTEEKFKLPSELNGFN